MTHVTTSILTKIALTETKELKCKSFYRDNIKKLAPSDYMKIAYILAKKSYIEGGCPIGAVIVNNKTGHISGKGHNTLVQENNPYNHGETSALRDAGRIKFGETTLYTTLNPCDICTALVYSRGFKKIVVGDVTNVPFDNKQVLLDRGIKVVILENKKAVELYRKFKRYNPDLYREDWKGM